MGSYAQAFNPDPFAIDQSYSATPAKTPSNQITPIGCAQSELGNEVDLLQVVEYALCQNYQTRQAWINTKIQAQQVGIAKSAYLPTADASFGYSRGPNSYQVKDTPELSFNSKTAARNISINANWVLFDFGLRQANLENARQLLIAASATQDASIQTVFVTAAQAYYDLLSAQSNLNVCLEAERVAGESFKAADAKYIAGIGTFVDKLQAQTDFAQAKLDRVKASGDIKIAQGTLAVTMGLDENRLLTVKSDAKDLPDLAFVNSVDQLILTAKKTHPSLIAARAQLSAANANISGIRDEGLPSIALFGSINRNQQSGQPPAATQADNSSIGIQLRIPLFEGFGRNYKVRQAQAQAESKAIDLAHSEQQISLEVWKNYQILTTETESLKATDELLISARASFKSAEGRYKAGVGNMLELLHAQNALSKANQQHVQNLSNWHIARLKLASSLGLLDMRSIK